MEDINWTEGWSSPQRALVSLIVLGSAAFSLSLVRTGQLLNIDVIGQLFIAGVLNFLTVPLYLLQDQIGFEIWDISFRPLEWNVLVLGWLMVGWSSVNVVSKHLNGTRTLVREPKIDILIGFSILPSLGGFLTAWAFNNTSPSGYELMGEVWILVTYNILLIPAVIYDNDLFIYDPSIYLGVIGAFVIAGLILKISRNLFTEDRETTPEEEVTPLQ